jgi:hypothetical protein
VNHITTTSFHPQSNGMIERSHRQIKDALRCRLAGVDWVAHLPWVLFSIRTQPKEDSGTSSAELVFGSPLCLPGEFLACPEPPAESFLADLRTAPPPPTTWTPTYAQVAASPSSSLSAASFVYVRRGGAIKPLSPLYDGPYAVHRGGPKIYLIDIVGRHESVSVDRLKPHLGKESLTPALPSKRGRPPHLRTLSTTATASTAAFAGGAPVAVSENPARESYKSTKRCDINPQDQCVPVPPI